MARDLAVYRWEDVVPVPPDSWRARPGAVCLYDQPLGSESAVREFWSGYAIDLDLPLFMEIYAFGFYHGIRWSGEQLRAVAAEMEQLEADWADAGLPPETLADLRQRAGFVREAVAIAAGCGGWVIIT